MEKEALEAKVKWLEDCVLFLLLKANEPARVLPTMTDTQWRSLLSKRPTNDRET